ncbi:hypothetical protein TorRG33x02_181430 [Trema orientale]|uniref:Uncharacterized protein n=1 Tax=Trema orientale TaxID=63057 RepID=A0A2P5EKL9_TREOI|nr:hypothetical protein TorRG33x02_181430 [Trema orientale]
MDMSKNIPIDLEIDDDQIHIAEEGDQVPEMQTNPNASRSYSQFQDSYSPSASTTSKRARTISNVWDHFDMEFKYEIDKFAFCTIGIIVDERRTLLVPEMVEIFNEEQEIPTMNAEGRGQLFPPDGDGDFIKPFKKA